MTGNTNLKSLVRGIIDLWDWLDSDRERVSAIRNENERNFTSFVSRSGTASDPGTTRLSVVTCKRVINPPRKGLARPWRTRRES